MLSTIVISIKVSLNFLFLIFHFFLGSSVVLLEDEQKLDVGVFVQIEIMIFYTLYHLLFSPK